MASSLLRCELQSELDALDKNQKGTKKLANKSTKVALDKRYKKYRPDPRIAADIEKGSSGGKKKREADRVQENVDKLLKSGRDFANNGTSCETILEHDKRSKRTYEPKGRSLLKSKTKAKKNKEGQRSAFSASDFEKFAQEYFINSKVISSASLGSHDDN